MLAGDRAGRSRPCLCQRKLGESFAGYHLVGGKQHATSVALCAVDCVALHGGAIVPRHRR